MCTHAHVLALVHTRRSSRVCSTSLWILGEYSTTADDIGGALGVIKSALGPLPLLAPESEWGRVHRAGVRRGG
jgi:hypothetical protein